MSKTEYLNNNKMLIFYRALGDTTNSVMTAIVNKTKKRYNIGDTISINNEKHYVLFRDNNKNNILVVKKGR